MRLFKKVITIIVKLMIPLILALIIGIAKILLEDDMIISWNRHNPVTLF